MTDDATTTPQPYVVHDRPPVAPPLNVVEEQVAPEGADKIDLTGLSETLNGYDQIAIRARFRERFDQLAEDPMMFPRAMYFIHLRRNGEKDAAAYEAAMTLPMKRLTELFDAATEDDELDGDETAVAERDREYGDFVVGTGLSFTVEQYMDLTVQQRARIIEAANRR
jgi:hypothetical protein